MLPLVAYRFDGLLISRHMLIHVRKVRPLHSLTAEEALEPSGVSETDLSLELWLWNGFGALENDRSTRAQNLLQYESRSLAVTE